MSDGRRAELEDLGRRLVCAWSAETSSLWSSDNPARGQCSVTAIVVQQLHGGDILMTPTPGGAHFYNRIDGERFDFTAAQFPDLPTYEDRPSDAAAAMLDTSPAQLAALLHALERKA